MKKLTSLLFLFTFHFYSVTAQKDIFYLKNNHSISVDLLNYGISPSVDMNYSYFIKNDLSIGLNIEFIDLNYNHTSFDQLLVLRGQTINPEIKYYFNRKKFNKILNYYVSSGLYYNYIYATSRNAVMTNTAKISMIQNAYTRENNFGISPRIGATFLLGKKGKLLLEFAFMNYFGYSVKVNQGDELEIQNYKAESSKSLYYFPGMKIGLGYLLLNTKVQTYSPWRKYE